MPVDLIFLHAPSVYDFREKTILYGPISEQIPSSPVFEMYPIGLTSIAEYLERAGYRVRIVNLAVRMLNDRNFNAEKMIERLNAPVFGIDLHWMVHCHGAIEVARIVKRYHPGARVLVGGFSASYFYRELMKYPEVDYVMRGDSTEEPVRQLMDCMKRGGEPEAVPNLIWRDAHGKLRENAFSHMPTDLNNVMVGHYANTVRSVIKYRDLASYIPFRGWTRYPITGVFTCRGCTQNCVICGGSAGAFRKFLNRQGPAFRSPEAVVRDVRQIARFSNGPVFILGDLRQGGDEYASELLRLLRRYRVNNRLIFEIFTPAPKDFLRQLGEASPNFCLEISPESHGPVVRKAEGRLFSAEDLEKTVGDALDAGCSRLDVFFMIGLPKQTPQSVLETIDYCGHLLDKFKSGKRLLLFIAPLAPFLDPGSLAFEEPEQHGYHVLFRSLAEHRQALLAPSWKYSMNYETDWMTRGQVVDVTYKAMMQLNSLKAKHGTISAQMAEEENKRLQAAAEIVPIIDDIMSHGGDEGELLRLKARIDGINLSTFTDWAELRLPVGAVKLKLVRPLWSWLVNR